MNEELQERLEKLELREGFNNYNSEGKNNDWKGRNNNYRGRSNYRGNYRGNNRGNYRGNNGRSNFDIKNVECYSCHKKGHYANSEECEMFGKKKDYICYNCGTKGHVVTNCQKEIDFCPHCGEIHCEKFTCEEIAG